MLSLCMPSNRKFDASRAAIESALAYAEATGGRLILSDNSGDAEKRAYFEGRSKRLTYLVPSGTDPMVNMMTALSAADTDFVMPMGDDDEIYFVEGEEQIDLSALPAEFIGVRPQTQIWTRQDGVRQTERFEITGATAADRILEYNQKARGNNSIYYSAYRSRCFIPLFKLFQDAHPTCGGYCDWALCFAWLACGKMAFDPSTIYRYDLGRWAERQSMERTKQSLFEKAGLPAEAEKFSALLTFVDLHTFLLARCLPLSVEERQGALVRNCQIALATFLRKVKEEPEQFDDTVRHLAQMIEDDPDINSAFQISVMLMDFIQPGLKDRYVRFFQQATAVSV